MQQLEPVFRLSQMPWVRHRVALAVGQKGCEPQVNADLPARRLMHDCTGDLHPELDVVAVRTPHDAYSLDLVDRKSLDVLARVAHQPQAPNAAAICEPEVPPIGF